MAKDVHNIRLLKVDTRFFSNVVIGLEAISIDTLETASDSKKVEFVNCISLNAKVM